MAKREKRKPKAKVKVDWKPIFLDAYAQTGNVRESCEIANISRTEYYRARKRSQKFAEAADEAEEQALDLIEQVAWLRARGMAQPDGTYLPPNERLIMFLLKTRRSEKYGDRSKVELTGENGGPLVFDVAQMQERIKRVSADPQSMAHLRALAEREDALMGGRALPEDNGGDEEG